MIVIFDRAIEGLGQIAINAFQVTRVVPSSGKQCSIFTQGNHLPELVKGSLLEVTIKLNEFTNA